MLPYVCSNISKVALAVAYSFLGILPFSFWVFQTLIGLVAKILDVPYLVSVSFWVNVLSLGALRNNLLSLVPLLRLSIAPSLRLRVSSNGLFIFFRTCTSLAPSFRSYIVTTRVPFTLQQTMSFMSAPSTLISIATLCVKSC
jgi:hypothetical protein